MPRATLPVKSRRAALLFLLFTEHRIVQCSKLKEHEHFGRSSRGLSRPRGLVARVSALLYKWGANILHADQHQDHELGLFFMRVEWALADAPSLLDSSLAPPSDSTTPRTAAGDFDLQGFQAEFAALAAGSSECAGS